MSFGRHCLIEFSSKRFEMLSRIKEGLRLVLFYRIVYFSVGIYLALYSRKEETETDDSVSFSPPPWTEFRLHTGNSAAFKAPEPRLLTQVSRVYVYPSSPPPLRQAGSAMGSPALARARW